MLDSSQIWFKCFNRDGSPTHWLDNFYGFEWSFPRVENDNTPNARLIPGEWQTAYHSIEVTQYIDPLLLSKELTFIYVVEIVWVATMFGKRQEKLRLVSPVPDGRFENQFGIYYFYNGVLHNSGDIPAVTLKNGQTFWFENGVRQYNRH